MKTITCSRIELRAQIADDTGFFIGVNPRRKSKFAIAQMQRGMIDDLQERSTSVEACSRIGPAIWPWKTKCYFS
jgi:hypothetical protein